MPQSQIHGFIFENEIRVKVFGLDVETNSTNKHDIVKEDNKFNSNENISIKTIGQGNSICFADIERFYNYDFSNKNTIVICKYRQEGNSKALVDIIEIDYNQECHDFLWGDINLDIITKYVRLVKSIPKGKVSNYHKKVYKDCKKVMESFFNLNININPKVDSKGQRRVQCSISNFEEKLRDFITYKSSISTGLTNMYRNKKLIDSIISPKRKRTKQ